MKEKIKKIFFAFLALSLLLIPSCNSFDSDDDVCSPASNETGMKTTLTLSLGDGSARTALPDAKELRSDGASTDDYGKVTSFTLTGVFYGSGATASATAVTTTKENTWRTADGVERLASAGVTWTSDDSETAFTKMCAETLGLAEGWWTFTLVAKVGNSETPLAVYNGFKTVQIASGNGNTVNFTLSLSSLNVNEENGTGSLSITLKLGATARSKVKTITGKLYTKATNELVSESGWEQTVPEGTTEYSCDYTKTVAAGKYIAKFVFYADTAKNAPIAAWSEVVNINSLGAHSEKTFESFDETYPITYLERLNFTTINEITSETANNSSLYSRNSSFALSAPSKTGYTFWRWVRAYKNSDNTYTVGYPVDSIADEIAGLQADGSTAVESDVAPIGERYYCAEFINADAVDPITKVVIYNDNGTNNLVASDYKVGHTLTAKAYSSYTDETTKTQFESNEIVWQWFVKGSGSEPDTALDSTFLKSCEAQTGFGSATDSNTSTIIVPASLADKEVYAVAIQKYIVTMDGNGAISNVKENRKLLTSLTTDDNAQTSVGEVILSANSCEQGSGGSDVAGKVTKKTSDVVAINKGTLVNIGIKLNRIATSADSTSTPLTTVIGETFATSVFNFTEGSVKDEKANWTVATNQGVTPSTSNAANAGITITKVELASNVSVPISENAPEADAEVLSAIPRTPKYGGNYAMWVQIEAAGYEPLVTKIENVPILVQAKAPCVDTATVTAITLRDKEMVTKGKIRFRNESPVDVKYFAGSYEILAADTTLLEYSFTENGTYTAWPTISDTDLAVDGWTPEKAAMEIAVPSTTSDETVSYNSVVYVRTKAHTADDDGGAIDASASIPVTISDYIGTLVRFAGINFSYKTWAYANTGVYDAENDEYAATEHASYVEGAEPQVGTTISLIKNGDAGTAGITATYTYDWKVLNSDGTVYASATEPNEEAFTGPTFDLDSGAYAGKTLEVTVTAKYPTGTNEDVAEDSVAQRTKTISAPIAMGNLKVDEISVTYQGMEMLWEKPSASKVVTGSSSKVTNELAQTLPVTYSFAPTTRVEVSNADVTTAVTELIVSSVGYNDKKVYINIHVNSDIIGTMLSTSVSAIPDGCIMFKATDYYKYEYALPSTTDSTTAGTWLPVPAPNTPINGNGNDVYNVSSPFSAGNKIFFRFKKTAEISGTVYYYTENTSKWVDSTNIEQTVNASDVVIGTNANEASAGVALTLTENYIGTHAATITISTSLGDIPLIQAGKSLLADENYTDYRWYVDEVLQNDFVDSQIFNVTGIVTGQYVVRLEAKDSFGDLHSKTAIIKITK